jgi:hypothetical protein
MMKVADELEKIKVYNEILEKENKELKERIVQERNKAYACGWVDGRNEKPPTGICDIDEVIEVHKYNTGDAIVSVDGAYVTVSQLIIAFHDFRDRYNKLRKKEEE